MNRALLLFAILSLTQLCQAADPEWQRVQGKSKDYSAEFPAKPTVSEVGLVLELEGGKAAMLIDVRTRPLPLDLEDQEAVDAAFRNAEIAMVKAARDAKILRNASSTFGKQKYPMREYDLDASKLTTFKSIYRAKLISSSKKFYQVVVLGPVDWVDGEAAKRFMDSFKIADEDL